MEELLQMSLMKDVNPKDKKKAGEEYIPGSQEVDDKKVAKIMALFDDVPPPKKGFFKKKGKDGLLETGSDDGTSP